MRKRIDALVYVLIWMIPLAGTTYGANWCWNHYLLVNHSCRTVGKVIGYEHRRGSFGRNRNIWRHVHTVRYDAFTREVVLGKEFSVNTPLYVRYLPAHPEVLDVSSSSPDFTCVDRTFVVLGTVVAPILLVPGMFCGFQVLRSLWHVFQPGDSESRAAPEN